MAKILLLPLAVLIAASPALGQSLTSIESSNPTPAPKPVSNLDKIVCEKVVRTGSRLEVDKVCMTAAQWADHKDGHREDLEKVQQVVNQNPSK